MELRDLERLERMVKEHTASNFHTEALLEIASAFGMASYVAEFQAIDRVATAYGHLPERWHVMRNAVRDEMFRKLFTRPVEFKVMTADVQRLWQCL